MAIPRSTSGNKKNILLPVIIGSVSLAIVVIALLFKGSFTDDQKYFFKILFAIGCAGVAAAIPGFLNLQFKKEVSAGGALAVFIFVYIKSPDVGSKRFDYTIYLKDSATGQTIIQPDLRLNVQLANDRPLGELSPKSGGYKFSNIPAEFKSAIVSLSLSPGSGWVFPNTKYETPLQLTNDFSDIFVTRSCILKGVVLKDETLIAGEDSVLVLLQNESGYQTYTDKEGYFLLNISGLHASPPYTVVFRKGARSMSYNLDCDVVFKQKLLKSN